MGLVDDLVSVSPIGFGCMGMTAFYGPAMQDGDGVALLEAVRVAGCTHFDTAEIYQQFREVLPGTCKYNEELLGKWIATLQSRASVQICTKYWPAAHGNACDYDTLSACVDASLSRLGVDYIDLYYCHRMPASIEKLEEWMTSLKAIVESGRVRHVGLSEVPAGWLRRAHAVHPVAVVQQEWSLLSREPCESEIVPVCRELGIGIVAYSPLARNLLAEPRRDIPQDWRADHPRWLPENYAANLELYERVSALATSKGLSGAQLSLAWLLEKAKRLGIVCMPIPGTTSTAHAMDNLRAAGVELTDAEMGQLEELGATVAGSRANESYLGNAVEGKKALL